MTDPNNNLIATPTNGSNDELVTVADFPDPIGANMARTALESAGIECFVQGGTANSMIPVAFMARLQVRPEDEAAARAILDDAEDAPESIESVTAAEMAGEDEQR